MVMRNLQAHSVETEKAANARVFDELSGHDSRIGQELLQQKVSQPVGIFIAPICTKHQTN